MKIPTSVSPVALALALLASPLAAAAQDHHAHQQDHHAHQKPRGGIAEGKLEKGVRTFEIAVTDDGFEPSRVKVKKGEKVKFVVTRKTERTCAKEIVMKQVGIEKPLPLGQPVTVEFTPEKSGEIRYACGMDHVSGVVFIP
jgi:plastocyanin domain-containing protein